MPAPSSTPAALSPPSPPPSSPASSPSQPDLPTQMLTEWKKSVEGQWFSVHEEWATERKQLTSAHKEWESKVKSVESNLGMAAAKFDAALASLAVLQRQQQQQQKDRGTGGQ